MSPSQQAFLDRLRRALRFAADPAIPTAVTLAQAIVESGWGRSGLARKGNALFGIKARASWPGPVYSGTTKEWDGQQYVLYRGTGQLYASYAAAFKATGHGVSLFRGYRSYQESIRDHARFFLDNPRYEPALRAWRRTGDPFIFVRGVHAAGYATGPRYADTLIATMLVYAVEYLPPWRRPAQPAAPVRTAAGRFPVEVAA